MSRILIVDNDAGHSQSVQRLLCAECFIPVWVPGVREAAKALARQSFAAVLLMDAPPAVDGPACCRGIREGTNLPLILLSPDGALERRVRALENGADDCVVSPFDPRELVARLRAVLRGRGEYSAHPSRQPIVIGGLVVDVACHEAHIQGVRLDLTNREFSILRCLAERVGEAVPRDTLFEDVWGYDAQLGGKLLEVYIRRVRRKLEPDPSRPVYLKTLRGFGYRLVEPDGT